MDARALARLLQRRCLPGVVPRVFYYRECCQNTRGRGLNTDASCRDIDDSIRDLFHPELDRSHFLVVRRNRPPGRRSAATRGHHQSEFQGLRHVHYSPAAHHICLAAGERARCIASRRISGGHGNSSADSHVYAGVLVRLCLRNALDHPARAVSPDSPP